MRRWEPHEALLCSLLLRMLSSARLAKNVPLAVQTSNAQAFEMTGVKRSLLARYSYRAKPGGVGNLLVFRAWGSQRFSRGTVLFYRHTTPYHSSISSC